MSMGAQGFAWLLLAVSVLAEVVGTIALRYADGFSRLVPSVVVVSCYAGAIWLMSLAVKHLDVGLSYAVLAGCGTALTALVGMVWFDEPSSLFRLSGLVLIVVGVVVLNLGSPT